VTADRRAGGRAWIDLQDAFVVLNGEALVDVVIEDVNVAPGGEWQAALVEGEDQVLLGAVPDR
jgi:hypothetical protein